MEAASTNIGVKNHNETWIVGVSEAYTVDMDRHQTTDLRIWLQDPRRKPLVVRGARQVGKSTLVELFAKGEGRGLSTINLERHPGLDELFASNDPLAILNLLDSLVEAPLPPDGVLFLDEIQAVPAAMASLRYFLEELPELPVVAAGSLMEFALADHAFAMPVGRMEYLNMGPMTFTEFLGAVGKEGLARAVDAFEWPPGKETSIPAVVHERLLTELRLYHTWAACPKPYESSRSPAACVPSAPYMRAWSTPIATTSRSTLPAET